MEILTSSERDAEYATRISRVRIVLVGTTHPGNIGASARAMKAMGLRDMALVNPRNFPSAEATAMASGADDILANAAVSTSLQEALTGCATVFATTARARHLDWPTLSPGEAAAILAGACTPAAIVFGREQSGLSNTELDLCQHAIRIPTVTDFGSLNLAQAVQICAYEVRVAVLNRENAPGKANLSRDPEASAPEINALYEHVLQSMLAVSYLDPMQPKLLRRRVRRLLNRAQLRHSEVQILRGFLAAIDRRLARGLHQPSNT